MKGHDKNKKFCIQKFNKMKLTLRLTPLELLNDLRRLNSNYLLAFKSVAI
jgi:hypothetical protein